MEHKSHHRMAYKTKAPRRRRRIKIRRYFFLLSFILVLYIFVGGDYGLYRIWCQKRQIRGLREDIEVLKKENAELEKKIELLKNDLGYIEKIAREEYGMVKKGETAYRVLFRNRSD